MPQTLTFVVTDNTAQSHFHNDIKLSITSAHVISGGSFFLCDAAGGSFAITLPDATVWKHRMITIKKTTAANTLTVDTTSSQTIDDVTSKAITAQFDGFTAVSDGINWHIEP